MNEPDLVHVRIGQLAIGHSPTILKATLGSCIGVALLWRARGVYGLAHCLLPLAPDASIGHGRARYVDQAVISLLDAMGAMAEHHAEIEAHLAGGGNMMQRTPAAGRVLPVGQLNIEAAQRVLEAHGIKVHSADLAGFHARQIQVDCASGSVKVTRVPAPDGAR
ncbi:chemotaxis protein CheD [Massilia solisilvae]|uniref:Probable chemoreceptor glutamine deamidase CheD n=1 Tax=Massilia solisilvae TaxID=1811225 RepID=A0ABT2BQS2_9BURK|nr:chemotaxis protein CheD [Massilia solisilvae]MCS0610859.1 chemotaxis protein CheD [Massilia solisilvae]